MHLLCVKSKPEREKYSQILGFTVKKSKIL